MAKTLVRFDWAMKRLLRQKSNFDILEGFLSELLKEDIKIEQILESESNQEMAGLKFNRVDMLAQNSKGQLIIIELQADSEKDYFYRILFATSKAVVEHFQLSEPYHYIKKVYSINIVYFNLGQGKDYVYHGKTEFRGMHTNDVLGLSARQRKGFALNQVYEIYPEYYILKIDKFNDLAKDTLDEWIYYLKHNEIKSGSVAKGLVEVQQKLEFYALSESDRAAYLKAIENTTIERDVMDTKFEDGFDKGRQEGEQIGLEKATRQGILRALQQGKLTLDEIAELFGVSLQTVLDVQTTLPD
ncbi:MAG: Rpn family recombination-promoting nuclease/putative transposase [Cytophagales bacterium]|nr:MAG: Rpn family recombination-promoting nuclease/putative transposase [Cytophagales bacterium]